MKRHKRIKSRNKPSEIWGKNKEVKKL
jgi:hypothetical protein